MYSQRTDINYMLYIYIARYLIVKAFVKYFITNNDLIIHEYIRSATNKPFQIHT
jgi:hypothetical protein